MLSVNAWSVTEHATHTPTNTNVLLNWVSFSTSLLPTNRHINSHGSRCTFIFNYILSNIKHYTALLCRLYITCVPTLNVARSAVVLITDTSCVRAREFITPTQLYYNPYYYADKYCIRSREQKLTWIHCFLFHSSSHRKYTVFKVNKNIINMYMYITFVLLLPLASVGAVTAPRIDSLSSVFFRGVEEASNNSNNMNPTRQSTARNQTYFARVVGFVWTLIKIMWISGQAKL